jgi:tripartite-type tricarboxylate transporter receptor subunit TctC
VRELPEIPPIGDTLPGYEVLSWAGLMLPAKASKELVAMTHRTAVAALTRPDVAKRFEELGFAVQTGSGDELQTFVKGEIEMYRKLIRQVGMPLQ